VRKTRPCKRTSMLDKDRPLRHSEEGDEVQTLARTLTV
jgi:hypothetical protein